MNINKLNITILILIAMTFSIQAGWNPHVLKLSTDKSEYIKGDLVTFTPEFLTGNQTTVTCSVKVVTNASPEVEIPPGGLATESTPYIWTSTGAGSYKGKAMADDNASWIYTAAFTIVEYRPGPAMTGEIKKAHDMKWFHVSESCNLRAKGTDIDEKTIDGTTWTTLSDNYIDLPFTTWTGEGITSSTGSEITWAPDSPTSESGVQIKATLKDHTFLPRTTADDPDLDVTRTMYAYEAIAHLNGTGSTTSPTTVIYETTSNGPKEIQLSLAHPQVIANGTDPASTQTINRFGTATWILETNPNAAELSSGGQLKAKILAHVAGTFEGNVYDADIFDDPIIISVGLTAGAGIAAGVSLDITITNEDIEAAVVMGFAFSSDDLGGDNFDKLEMVSNDDPDPVFDEYWDNQTPAFGYVPSSVILRGPKAKESKAKALVEGLAKAIQVGDATPISAIAKMQSFGRVIYTVESAGYETGTMLSPESGY